MSKSNEIRFHIAFHSFDDLLLYYLGFLLMRKMLLKVTSQFFSEFILIEGRDIVNLLETFSGIGI